MGAGWGIRRRGQVSQSCLVPPPCACVCVGGVRSGIECECSPRNLLPKWRNLAWIWSIFSAGSSWSELLSHVVRNLLAFAPDSRLCGSGEARREVHPFFWHVLLQLPVEVPAAATPRARKKGGVPQCFFHCTPCEVPKLDHGEGKKHRIGANFRGTDPTRFRRTRAEADVPWKTHPCARTPIQPLHHRHPAFARRPPCCAGRASKGDCTLSPNKFPVYFLYKYYSRSRP